MKRLLINRRSLSKVQKDYLGSEYLPGILTEEIFHIFSRQTLSKSFIVGDEVVGKDAFLFLELGDFVFNGILANQAVGEDIFLTDNAVCSVEGLLLNCRFNQESTIYVR